MVETLDYGLDDGNVRGETIMTMKNTAIACALLLSGPGVTMAQTQTQDQAQDQDPFEMPDESWIRLTGTVTSVAPESFMLDYGDGLVMVEFDDWDADDDAEVLFDGDRVTVYGRVEDDLFDTTTIEADNVYVKDLNTWFHASPIDEESVRGDWLIDPDLETGAVTYIGTVQSVDEDAEEFTLDADVTELTVDTSLMPYNPLDDEGFQQIEPGDRVSVTGVIDETFFGQRELVADSVITRSD